MSHLLRVRVLAIALLCFALPSVVRLASKRSASAPAASDTRAETPQPSQVTKLPDICITSAENKSHIATSSPHIVKLSWHASVPASTKPSDAIACYLVYRFSNSSVPRNEPIGVTRAPDTTYSDLHVPPGSYHYAVLAISTTGTKSGFSKGLPVEVPR